MVFHVPFLFIMGIGLAVLSCCSSVSRGDSVSLSPSADTCLFELDPEFNLGGQRDLPSGTLGSMVGNTKSRALYKFDIAASVPGGARIQAARFRVQVTKSPSGKNVRVIASTEPMETETRSHCQLPTVHLVQHGQT